MNASLQYIELYKAHSAQINAHSAAPMNRLREQALKVLLSTPLPHKGDEGYENFSLSEAFAPDYGINILRRPVEAKDVDSFTCLIPKVSSLNAAVLNDTLAPSAYMQRHMPGGVTVCTIAEAATRLPGVVEKYYGTIAPIERPEVALNTLLAQEGLMIHVAAGVKCDKPIQVTNLFVGDADIMAVRRWLVVMEEGAEAEILVCDHSRNPRARYLSSQVIEAYCAPGSVLQFYDLEESSALTTRVSGFYARQDKGSDLLVNGSTLVGGTTRNDFLIDIIADRCSTSLSGMVIASGHQLTDNASLIIHRSCRSTSSQLFKYVLDDEARGAFEGSIKVEEGATYTEAYQSNRNLLASQGARMHTRPQLEIYCDEVKCSHGATTGQLDERALFYMRSRGIPEAEARTMLMQAFMMDVVDTVRLEGLRDRLRYLVEKRLSGRKVLCADCSAHGSTQGKEASDE